MTKVLSSGYPIPLIGLGTFKIRGHDDIAMTLDAGLSAGYRAIDTAGVYRNEADIGKALKSLLPKHGLTRSDLHITSKLAPKHQGAEKCRAACLQSLSDLGLNYLDLYLIHWPGSQGMQPEDHRHPALRAESWRDMEELVKEGKLKSIGVSNYTLRHLEELLSLCTIKPTVLQCEYHPHLVQTELVEFCKEHDVHFQAYSSLGTSSSDRQLLTDPCIALIAQSINRPPAQVLLRWAVQQNIGVLPKSTNPSHITSNKDIFQFELEPQHMEQLSALHSGTHYCWDPAKVT